MDFAYILKFLRDLAKNNEREWFEKNKDRYTTAKTHFDEFVAKLLPKMIEVDGALSGLDPKKLTFRIYRDVRFSKDKSPYKKNMSAAFSESGKGMGTPGYYFHVEPSNKSFFAAGIFMPPADRLAKIRQEIDYNGKNLDKILSGKNFKDHFSKLWDGDALKTAAKGFAKDHPYLELLKLKSFIVEYPLKDVEITDKKLMGHLLKVMRTAKPLNNFLTEAIS